MEAADFAPHDLASLEAQSSARLNPNGKFWRIEHANGAISHLWGTMHVSLPEVLDLPDIVIETIKSSRQVALEIDFTFQNRDAMYDGYDAPGRFRDAADPFAAQEMLDLSFLGPEPVNWVLDRLAFSGGEDTLFILTYAGLAELLLSDPCEDFTASTIPNQDSLIQTFAHIAGSEVRGLEAPGEILIDLANDPETAQAMVAVYASYLQPPDPTRAFNASAQLYLEGRLGLMMAWDAKHQSATYGKDGERFLRLADDYLLTKRNQRFLKRLTNELPNGGVFLAVGAFHLPGETGLIELLRGEGYKVTRIPLTGEIE